MGLWRVNSVRNTVWIIVSFLVGIILGTLFIISYEKLIFRPFEWTESPIILNCYGKELDKLYIMEAVHYWTIKGHSFSYIENNPPTHICKADHIQGFIMIKKKDLPYNTLGVTRRRIFMNQIVSAIIEFASGTYRIDNVFEHELGHALGYGHVEIEGHIMHPLWEKMSPKFWIPE